MMKNSCHSCLMPFKNDPGQRESDQYCSLCFADGKFRYEGNDRKEFQRLCEHGMKERGMHPLQAKFYAWLVRFAPRWKK